MSSEQQTIPGGTRRLMFHTLAKTTSKYLEMDADITWTLRCLPLCYSLNHKILNFRVVNVTFSGGKYPGGAAVFSVSPLNNICLYLSLLYLVPVVNAPAPLGSLPSRLTSHHNRLTSQRIYLHTILNKWVCAIADGSRSRYCCYYLAIIITSLQVWCLGTGLVYCSTY